MPRSSDNFYEEEIAKGKVALLWIDEFNKKQQESIDLAAKAEKTEKLLQRTRVTSATVAVAAYVKMASSIKSLNRAGLEHTAEVRRQEVAYQLLGREIAAVFLPATTASTNASLATANAMSRLTGKGQDLLFVAGSAAAGLAAFSTVSLLAAASGVKLTGTLAGLVKILPLLGLGVGLAAIFLSSDEGAKQLEETMKSLIDLANELGDALDDALRNRGKFADDFMLGLTKIGEDLGILEKGAARKFFDEVTVPNAKARGGLDERRARAKDERRQVTPGVPSFGSIDSFERIQLAAAKVATGKDIPQQQLDVAKEQLEVQKQLLQKDAGEGMAYSSGGDY